MLPEFTHRHHIGDCLHLTATGKKKVGVSLPIFDSTFNQENNHKKSTKNQVRSYSRWTESKYEFEKSVVLTHCLPIIFNCDEISQGINRTLLSWMKLWDETVFGHSSLSTTSGDASKYSSKEKRGGGSSGSGAAPHGSTSGKRSFDGKREGKSHGAKGEWQELADSMFASEEVCFVIEIE